MSGVGSTNAMKKGSGNNPFLAYSEVDMQNYLNSAYVGCIVKYAGPSTRTPVPRGHRLNLGDAQNLVVDLTKKFTYSNTSYKPRRWDIGIESENTVNRIQDIEVDSKTGIIGSGRNDIKALICSNYNSVYGKNINDISVKFLAVSNEYVDRKVIVNWPVTYGNNGWQSDCFNDSGKITLWGYEETVTAYQDENNEDYWDNSVVIYTEPYAINKLYKVAYGNGRYYFEEFYYISENITTGTVEDVAPGKTFYDFTGTKQTGTGTKINPYLATDIATFKSYPIGSFIKWLGPNKTILDETTGQMLIQGEVYRAVEDGDVFQYAILPTLSNPADPIDVAEGKEVINQLGAVMIGTGNNILQASTTAGMQALFIDANIGKIAKYVGETDVYIKDAFYLITADANAKQYYELPVLTNEGTASDLAQGKQLIDGYGKVVEGTFTDDIDYTQDVMFWDYDGKLIYACTLDEAKAMTKLPDVPDHSDKGLVFLKWNYTLDDIKNISHGADIGALYETSDGKTHLFFDIVSDLTKDVTLYIKKSYNSQDGTLRIDWGDGTDVEIYEWDKNTTPSSANFPKHTYTMTGQYEVKIENISAYKSQSIYLGSISYSISEARNLFGQSLRSSSPNTVSTILTKAYVGKKMSISCGNCINLKEVSLYNAPIAPCGFKYTQVKHVNTLGNINLNAFYDSAIQTFSCSATSSERGAFHNCSNIKRIACKAYTQTYSDAVSLNLPLLRVCIWPRYSSYRVQLNIVACKKVVLDYVTQWDNSNDGTSLYLLNATKLYMKKFSPYGNNTKVAAGIISAPMLEQFIMDNVTPTPLTAAFTKIPNTCKYYVPDSAVDAYKATEGWSSMADRIYPMSALTN